jgi:nitroimidazol reductase NimA-like FMN-containing flavoprotein (pyridoxamine 5'-phosphate oxidase superfamily)
MTTDIRNGMEMLELDECWRLIETTKVGRLAVSIANHPDIFPVNHVVDERTIIFRTAEGTKLAAALLGTAVAFEIDGWDDEAGSAWSVVVKGHAVELERLLDVLHAEELPLYPWNGSYKPRFVKIEADEISGRRFAVVPGTLHHHHD